MPKQILFVHYTADVNGSATSLGLVIKYLDRSSFAPRVVLTHPFAGNVGEYFRGCGAAVDHLPVNLVWDYAFLHEENLRGGAWRSFFPDARFAAYLDRIKPDLVHVNDFPPVTAGVTAAAKGYPVVWHCRAVFLHALPFWYPDHHIIRTMVKSSKKIIAISESEVPQFKSDKVEVIYNGLETERIERARGKGADKRRELGFAPDDYIVLAPVPLTRDKGAWDFIAAAGLAKRLCPERRFRFLITGVISPAGRRHLLRKWTRILGPRSAQQEADAHIRAAGVGADLSITGHRKDIYELMDASDLIVFPSHLKACGRQCFEGGALGKPVIVTMPDKNTRVIRDGETGLIVPDKRPDLLGAAIARLARDPAEGARLGQAAIPWVAANFDARVQSAKVAALYEGVLGTS